MEKRVELFFQLTKIAFGLSETLEPFEFGLTLRLEMLKVDVRFAAGPQIEPMALTGQRPLCSGQFFQMIFDLFATLNQQFQRFDPSGQRRRRIFFFPLIEIETNLREQSFDRVRQFVTLNALI